MLEREDGITYVRVDISGEGTAVVSDVLVDGEYSTVYRFDNPLLERHSVGPVASQRDIAITRARDLGVPFAQINRGLIGDVLNAKATAGELAKSNS